MKFLVSIIIPCRNEEKFIGKCLDSIIAQDYPKENLEILVVDGMSQDRTRKILKEYQNKYSFIKVLNNPKKIVPIALNIGIAQSRGEYILRADAHSKYSFDYISKCVQYLKKSKADCVGGTLNTLPSRDDFVAKGIAIILSHPFGAGGRTFRTKRGEGYVDTVPFGAYKRKIFDKIGLFNKKLIRNQDIEFNSRIRKASGKIFITPKIRLSYFAPPTFKKLFFQQFQNGLWNIYTQKIVPSSLSLRHFIPLFFALGLLGNLVFISFFFWAKILFILILGSYILISLLISFKISLKKDLRYLIILPFAFFILHFSYGLGSIWGLLTLWKIKK